MKAPAGRNTRRQPARREKPVAEDSVLRKHVIELLRGGNAHVDFEQAVGGLPVKLHADQLHTLGNFLLVRRCAIPPKHEFDHVGRDRKLAPKLADQILAHDKPCESVSRNSIEGVKLHGSSTLQFASGGW